MSKTSTYQPQPQVQKDISLVESTLGNLTFTEFTELTVTQLHHLAVLLEAAGSDDLFVTTFPKAEIAYHYRELEQKQSKARKLARQKYAHASAAVYANHCQQKFRQKLDDLATMLAQMLRGRAFQKELFELLTKSTQEKAQDDVRKYAQQRLQAYEDLYSAVSGREQTLVDYHRSRHEAKLSRI